MTQMVDFYCIKFRHISNKIWSVFDETEYTEKEASRQVRMLNKENDGEYRFKKEKTGTNMVQVLTINTHK